MINPVSTAVRPVAFHKSVKHFFNRELIERVMDPKRAEIPWLRPYNHDIAHFNLKDAGKLKYIKP